MKEKGQTQINPPGKQKKILQEHIDFVENHLSNEKNKLTTLD